jgi:signal recognition particle receptor subunit alpha
VSAIFKKHVLFQVLALKILLIFGPMDFFIVFNKKGIVEQEEGTRPVFFNSLIKSLNFNQFTGTKNIQDKVMEYEILDANIYLTIGKKGDLKRFMEKYHRKENTEIEEIEEKKNEKEGETFAFEEKQSKTALILDSIKKVDFKKTFNLFKGKIKIEDLKLKFIEHLVNKNVDPSFCQTVTSDVISELKDSSMDLVSEDLFKQKLKKSLGKILPKFDHEGFLNKIKNHTGVYSICFVGVNGVGKSTSLAKIACWLIQNNLKVYIAACDTFRAGAIEQLKVHVERFKASGNDVGFFESGYSRDDSAVAKYAIMKAQKENYDVILIDTAGRMHNKEHLMISLTKLIKVNNPDHIVFVGEALVGGDSLNHIKEFNKRISDADIGRKIDSIILTKLDTVDDKVGQILNFTFTANSPIMFLGVGQSNVDLKPLDAETVSEILTS